MTPLRQRMLEDMSIRNLAENTQQSYLQQVSSFARYFGCPPDTIGPEKVREYQVHLVEDCKLAPGSTVVVYVPNTKSAPTRVAAASSAKASVRTAKAAPSPRTKAGAKSSRPVKVAATSQSRRR